MNWKVKDLELNLEKQQTANKEMNLLNQQFERRFYEASKNNSIILNSLMEITKKAESYSSENQ